jgi:hypothetical protein
VLCKVSQLCSVKCVITLAVIRMHVRLQPLRTEIELLCRPYGMAVFLAAGGQQSPDDLHTSRCCQPWLRAFQAEAGVLVGPISRLKRA